MKDDLPRQDDDYRLLAAVARGDRDAFAALYDRLSGPLYAMCLRMTGEPSDSEDILQEVCVTLWRRAATYDPARSSVFGWAVHITRCKVIDHLRARGRRLRVLMPDQPPAGGDAEGHYGKAMDTRTADGPGAGEVADQREQAGRVRLGLEGLPPDQSQAIELAFFSDLTHHEISARLGQPLGTIKARIRRGLLRLRDALKGERTEEGER